MSASTFLFDGYLTGRPDLFYKPFMFSHFLI